MEKNNKGLYIVISILGVLVVLLSGYIIYDKVLSNNNSINDNMNTDKDKDEKKEKDENNYTNWIDYVMGSDINSIELGYCVNDTENNNNGVPIKKNIQITKSELDKILGEVKKGTLTKNYYGGLGGPCLNGIDINYTVNSKEYKLNLLLYRIIDPVNTNDEKILSYLESSNYSIKKYSDEIDLDKEPYIFEYTYDENIIDTILNQHNISK